MTSNQTINPLLDKNCENNDRKWYIYIACDFGIYFGGLLFIVLWRLLKNVCCRRKSSLLDECDNSQVSNPINATENPVYRSQMQLENVKNEYLCFVAFRYYVSQLISTQFFSGRLLLLFSTIGSTVSVILYLYEVLSSNVLLERCYPLKNPIYIIDLGCNILFLVHFMLRLAGSSEKIKLWLNLYTVIDMFTIPQILVSIIIKREWIGLRFLRVAALNRLQTVLQSFNLITSATTSRVTQLLTLFVTILIGGAGFVHLLENSGEIHTLTGYDNRNEISYGNAVYFIVVTLSTVGYGDYSPKTVFGKIFVTIFILLALAVFASFIPELAEFLFSRSQYMGSYRKENGAKHVIVCGNINYASVVSFLSDFFHEDRCNTDIEVVFINKVQPDAALKSLLKTYFTRVKYFQGTVMDQNDLARVQFHTADACLILANQDCCNQNDEDSGNIMRAISLKNYCPQSPVIIQILQFENKIYLENIPAWSDSKGDQIICYSEIELGILAQSCLVPGFSTLLTNIFSVRSDNDCKKIGLSSEWIQHYLHGVTMEIYSAKLSDSFLQMSYSEVVALCFKNLNLLLIAVEIYDSNTNRRRLMLNPLNLNRVTGRCVGYFICDSLKDAKNASVYCTNCHTGLRNLKTLTKCSCIKSSNSTNLKVNSYVKPLNDSIISKKQAKRITALDEENNLEYIDSDIYNYIICNNFYHCEPPKIGKCLITSKVEAESLNDHIILCIFSDNTSLSVGIKNFLMPLRSISIPKNWLKTVVMVGEKNFLESEWNEISMFPKLKVVYYQSSIQRIIDLIHIETCSRCVIINTRTVNDEMKEQTDLYMVDKEVIIANLYLQNESRNRLLKKAGLLDEFRRSKRENLRDSVLYMSKNQAVCIEIDKSCSNNDLDCRTSDQMSNVHIPIISKLAVESNVQFLDNKNKVNQNNEKLPNYLRQPFAFGYVFTASMLDSLLSTAYFNQNSLKIMEMLINGGNPDDDNISENEYDDSAKMPVNKFHIELICATHFKKTLIWGNNICYRDFFLEILENYGYLCLGLYRKMEFNVYEANLAKNIDRYVITNPPSTFVMNSSDMAYCIVNDFTDDTTQKPGVSKTQNIMENIDIDIEMKSAPVCDIQIM